MAKEATKLTVISGPYKGIRGVLKRAFRSASTGEEYAYLWPDPPTRGNPPLIVVRLNELKAAKPKKPAKT